jgi:uncharacterized protein (TIGR04255 family)
MEMISLEALASRMNTDAGPSFRDPPVVETALSIQFDELPSFRSVHIGMYHATIKDRYPVVEDKPRLDRITESFPPAPRMQALRIGPFDGRPGRVWFRDAADGCTLLQLQPDRFAFNWCRKEGQEYPRHSSNQPRLLEEFERFRQFCRGSELGEVRPNLCEVTYVNHIEPANEESLTECFANVFTGIEWKSSDGWLPQPPESVSLNRVFEIGEQQGRLYAEAAIANDKVRGDFVLLKITARVIHREGDDLRANLNLAHDWVVKSFVSLTDPDIRQRRWRQER